MSDMRFTEDHEWVRPEEGGQAVVGISEYGQEALGDLIFVDLPTVGQEVRQGDVAVVVESSKVASEIYAPVSGRVVAVNEPLDGDPTLVNKDPLGKGWIYKIALAAPAELDGLMDEAAYKRFLDGLD